MIPSLFLFCLFGLFFRRLVWAHPKVLGNETKTSATFEKENPLCAFNWSVLTYCKIKPGRLSFICAKSLNECYPNVRDVQKQNTDL